MKNINTSGILPEVFMFLDVAAHYFESISDQFLQNGGSVF
jgi:hypothetical protein